MTESSRQRPSEGRRTTSHHPGMRDRHWAKGVGNTERRGKAKLLHRYSEAPHQGDHGSSLNRAARREVHQGQGQRFSAVQAGQTGLSES